VVSRPQDQIAGHKLRISAGKLQSIEETGAPAGTIVEVRDLFFNMPARRKFLRAARTETDHITDVFTRAALPYPGIAFRLDDGARTLMNFPRLPDAKERFSVLFGRQPAEAMIPIEEVENELTVRGYLAPPEFTRSRGDRIFIYTNGRNIRDRLVSRAILEGYGQRLMKGRYPQAVLFIDIDTATVDVNVHPTKQEVRFRNPQLVFQTITTAVNKALAVSFRDAFSTVDISSSASFPERESFPEVSEPQWQYLKRAPSRPGASERSAPQESLLSEGAGIIGQLGSTYVLCQAQDGLLLIDQHAAHERIVYEEIKQGFLTSRIEVQSLLVPLELEFTSKESKIIHEKKEDLARFGIELTHFGGNTFLLQAVPVLLERVDWPAFLSEVLTELERGILEDMSVLDKVLTITACHGALRAGHHMTREEMAHLLRQLEQIDLPTNCPHGRPLFKRLTYPDLEKMFKRVV
jgi:DNA mismatch repair protein MutL